MESQYIISSVKVIMINILSLNDGDLLHDGEPPLPHRF